MSDKTEIERLCAALREIQSGCIPRRPGHVDYNLNRTKDEIWKIAGIALRQACDTVERTS